MDDSNIPRGVVTVGVVMAGVVVNGLVISGVVTQGGEGIDPMRENSSPTAERRGSCIGVMMDDPSCQRLWSGRVGNPPHCGAQRAGLQHLKSTGFRCTVRVPSANNYSFIAYRAYGQVVMIGFENKRMQPKSAAAYLSTLHMLRNYLSRARSTSDDSFQIQG